MRRFPRALAPLLGALLIVSPIASAQPIFPVVVDEHIGQVDRDLDSANSTYGERSEFQRAQASLARSSLALLNDAWVVSHDELIKASGGLETGKARAQASGSGSQQETIDHGRQLASQAQSEVTQVRNNLESMERPGLEPVAFVGGLTAAYAANRAMDLLKDHKAAIDQWENGQQNEQAEATIVSTGAGANMAASMAADVLSETAEARANASATQLLSEEEIDELTQDRVGWAKANEAAVAQRSHDRLAAMDEAGERLMALSAFTIYFQDVAFNGVRQEQQRGGDIDAFQEAQDLHDRDHPQVEAWIEELDVPGGIALGAMASAGFSLDINQNKTGEPRQSAGAYALGMAHLGAEQAGLIQQAYGAQDHEPGTELATVELASEDEGFALVPSVGAVLGLLLLGLVAVVRRETR